MVKLATQSPTLTAGDDAQSTLQPRQLISNISELARELARVCQDVQAGFPAADLNDDASSLQGLQGIDRLHQSLVALSVLLDHSEYTKTPGSEDVVTLNPSLVRLQDVTQFLLNGHSDRSDAGQVDLF